MASENSAIRVRPGSTDVVLTSALPVRSGVGVMTAPLVWAPPAGRATAHRRQGKVAVQLVVPQARVFERGAVDSRAADLVARGAPGVFSLVRLPGNELSRDFINWQPLLQRRGALAALPRNSLDRATRAGVADRLRVRLELEAERSGLKAHNGVAVIPGRRGGETIVLNAHADRWFDGAGTRRRLAVLVALAALCRAGEPPGRTLVFVASAGHHPRHQRSTQLRLRQRRTSPAPLCCDQHRTRRSANFSPARSTSPDGYREPWQTPRAPLRWA
jgi:hypothetical protein